MGLLTSQLEEAKAQLESTERAYKAAHTEVTEAMEKVNELTAANAGLQAAKRKLDADIQALNVSSANESY